MHSDKCIIEPPAHGNAQSACLDFAVEFLRDDGAAFRSTSTFFEVPEHMESVLCSAPRSNKGELDVSLEEAISNRRSLALAGKPVDVRRDTRESLCDDRFLLPQFSALLSALRGTSGCVIVSSKGTTLCIGVHGQRAIQENIITEGDDIDEEDDDIELVPAAPSTICYDPTPRPLFKLRGASALRFTSVRGLQLHILAVLSSMEKPRPEAGDSVRLALLISTNRRDENRLGHIQKNVSRLRQKEKKRAITIQMAEIEALREHLRNDIHVESRLSLVRQPNSPRDKESSRHTQVADASTISGDKGDVTLLAPCEDAPLLTSSNDAKTNRLPTKIESPSSLDSFNVTADSATMPNCLSSPGRPTSSGLSATRSYDTTEVSMSPSPIEIYSMNKTIEEQAPSHVSTASFFNRTVPYQSEEELPANENPHCNQESRACLKQSSKSVHNEKNLFQAALAAYSLSLQDDYSGPGTSIAESPTQNSPDHNPLRESSNRAMRTLLSSIEDEDAEKFGARVYDVMRTHTLSHRAMAQMRSTSSLDVPFPPDEQFGASTRASPQTIPPPPPKAADSAVEPSIDTASCQNPRPSSKSGRESMASGCSNHELVSEVTEQEPNHDALISTHQQPQNVERDVRLSVECGLSIPQEALTAAEANQPQPHRINPVRERDAREIAHGAHPDERPSTTGRKTDSPKQDKTAEAAVDILENALGRYRQSSAQSTPESTNKLDHSTEEGRLKGQSAPAPELFDERDSILISSLERDRTEAGANPAKTADTVHDAKKGDGVVPPLQRNGQGVLSMEMMKAHVGPASTNGQVLEGQDKALHPPSVHSIYSSSALSRQVLLKSSTHGFVDVQTNDEELVFFGEDSVANVSQELEGDPILQVHELAVREDSRAHGLREDTSPQERNKNEVLVTAAQFDLRSAVTNFEAKGAATMKQPSAESNERKTSRPIGWAATFNMVSTGEIVSTHLVPKPQYLPSEPIELEPLRVTDGEDAAQVQRKEDFTELQRMQRFNERRSRKVRAMQERRRLEKEHRAALRAGAFEDVENVVGIDDCKPVRRGGTTRKPQCPIPRSAPGARKISNKRNISNARQTAFMPD